MKPIQTKRHWCGEVVHLFEDGFHHFHDRTGQQLPMTKCPKCKGDLSEDLYRELYRVDPMERQMMEKAISHYSAMACSNCWLYSFYVKDVFIQPENADDDADPVHLYYVLCTTCHEDTVGYVSSGYIGWREQVDRIEGDRALLSLLPAIGEVSEEEVKKRERRAMEQNIQELGF